MLEKPTPKDLQEMAVSNFCRRPHNFPLGRPFNCCESIMFALKDRIGLGNDIVPNVGTGMGAGVSLNGLLCGAVSGVAMAIGMKHGRRTPEEDPKPVWDLVDRYVSEFKERFGHVNCGQLTGLNLKTAEGLKEYYSRVHDYACAERVRFAVQKCSEIL